MALQQLSLFGLRYIREFVDTVSLEDAKKLSAAYSYVFIYSYTPTELPHFKIRMQPTPILKLDRPLPEIFGAFKKNTRNEIHKTERLPELECKGPDRDVRASYQLYAKIKRGDGVRPDIKREFKHCLFFNAYWNKKLVVSVSCYDNGKYLRLKHIVSLRKERGFDSRVAGYATRRIIWDICRWGNMSGRAWLDLGGINLAEKEKSGITAFKQSFGGEIVPMYIYRYETPAFARIKKCINLLGYNLN